MNQALTEINIIPAEAKNLAASQPIGKQKGERGIQRVASGSSQKPACLIN